MLVLGVFFQHSAPDDSIAAHPPGEQAKEALRAGVNELFFGAD
jgi:hypothetical protein